MIGKTIGKYRIVGQLGRGGMGTVYRAVDDTLDREVAIKVLNPEVAETQIMKRFRKEAITLAKLNHPEIATIYELFRSEEDLLMVMEFVRGETLDKISERFAAIAPEHAVYVIDKVLSALEHAHRAGIVHCDMKPANVMVTAYGGVKIMDFGIARVRGAEHATIDGYMMGTPAYMPPEQVLGQEVDARSDLYSVGIILYRLLTGALPFKADTAMGMVQKQISEEPLPLHLHREGLPDWCEPILQRALAKSPADRFQTAEKFREALEKAAGVLKPESAKAFFSSIADLEKTTPSPPAVLERFGLTPVWSGHPNTTTIRSVPDVGGPALGSGDRPGTNAAPTLVLPRRRSAMVGSLLGILAAGITALAIVRPWRPTTAVPPIVPTDASLPMTESTTPSAVELPDDTGRPTPSPAEATAVSPPETVVAARAAKPVAAPFVFDAIALVDDGDRSRERESQVFLVDGKINIKANDDDTVLYTLPLGEVVSISYSRGRDPLWNGPEGPARVTRGGSGLGIFRGKRHWVSLRLRNAAPRFVVLRLGNDARAESALAALEERTGRTTIVVAESQDDR